MPRIRPLESTDTENSTKTPATRANRQRSEIYRTDGRFLFVPTEDMWGLHEASKLSAILKRAGVGRGLWKKWSESFEEFPWLLNWLRGSRSMPDTGFTPTPEMLAFRNEATIRAVLAAAPRPKERMQEAWREDYLPHVGEALLSNWRLTYKPHTWFDGWLLRGENPPASVTIATVQQVRRCNCAWDFAAICRRVGIVCNCTYVQWLRRGKIPTLAWLKWLYGGPVPTGVFVVSEDLQRLRKEMSRKGIMRAAGISTASIWAWERDPRTSGPIKAILAGEDGETSETWSQVPSGTQQKMEVIGRLSSMKECRARAELPDATFNARMGEATRCGVKEELWKYLKSEGAHETPNRSGLVADNFFIATPEMLRFRKEAASIGAEQQVWSLQNTPGFDLWFSDWASPKSYRGRRHLVAMGDAGGIEKLAPRSESADRVRDNERAARNDSRRVAAAAGRPADPHTQEIYRFCYEKYVTEGKGAATVLRLVNKEFGEGTVKDDATVRKYAKRYAKRHGLPIKNAERVQN